MGGGKACSSDNLGRKLGFPNLVWSPLGILEIIFVEQKQAEILGVRLGSEMEGKFVTLPLMGGLEPKRHK